MTKLQFLLALRDKLSALPGNEAEERLRFYSEMIEDRVEEGLSEEEAVAAVGAVDQIADQILSDAPLKKNVNNQQKMQTQRKRWQTLLLVLGSPIWISLLVAVFTVIFSVYVSAWAVIVSLWACFVSVAICAIAGLMAGIGFAVCGQVPSGVAMIAASITSAGLSILFFLGCKVISMAMLQLTKKMVLYYKKKFTRGEDASCTSAQEDG